MPPSKTMTRSRVAARKSRIPRNRSATLTHLWQGWPSSTSVRGSAHLLDQVGRQSVVWCSEVPRSDLHQHLWPEALLRELAGRSAPPRLRLDGRDWLLELPGEP